MNLLSQKLNMLGEEYGYFYIKSLKLSFAYDFHVKIKFGESFMSFNLLIH